MVKIYSGEPTVLRHGLRLVEDLSVAAPVHLVLDAPCGFALFALAEERSPVVVLTGNRCPYYLLDLLDFAPEVLLAEPTPPGELRAALEEAAHGRRWMVTPPIEEYRQTLIPAERRVLRLIGFGLSNEQIAQRLGITLKTVSNYISAIKAKLEVDGTVELALYYRGMTPEGISWKEVPI